MTSVVELAEISNAVYDLLGRVEVNGQTQGTPTTVWESLRPWNPALGGFSAALYVCHATRAKVLAFAGTDSLWDVIADDGAIAGGGIPPQAVDAISAARDVVAETDGELYFTGHSLGGALAVLTSAWFDKAAVTFNAPGVQDSCVATAGAGAFSGGNMLEMLGRCMNSPRILNIRINADPVSSVYSTGAQPGTTREAYDAPQCGLDVLCRHGIATCIQAVRAEGRNFRPLNLHATQAAPTQSNAPRRTAPSGW